MQAKPAGRQDTGTVLNSRQGRALNSGQHYTPHLFGLPFRAESTSLASQARQPYRQGILGWIQAGHTSDPNQTGLSKLMGGTVIWLCSTVRR